MWVVVLLLMNLATGEITPLVGEPIFKSEKECSDWSAATGKSLAEHQFDNKYSWKQACLETPLVGEPA